MLAAVPYSKASRTEVPDISLRELKTSYQVVFFRRRIHKRPRFVEQDLRHVDRTATGDPTIDGRKVPCFGVQSYMVIMVDTGGGTRRYGKRELVGQMAFTRKGISAQVCIIFILESSSRTKMKQTDRRMAVRDDAGGSIGIVPRVSDQSIVDKRADDSGYSLLLREQQQKKQQHRVHSDG